MGLGATHDVHLRLIRKRVVDFLLVLIELFSLGVTAEALRSNIVLSASEDFLCSILRYINVHITLLTLHYITSIDRRFCSNVFSLAQNFRYKR